MSVDTKKVQMHLKSMLSLGVKQAFCVGDRKINKCDFVKEVALFQQQCIQNTSHQKWALCYQNGYQFAVALFAVLSSGRTPVLLPNNQKGTITSLSKEYDVCVSESDYNQLDPCLYESHESLSLEACLHIKSEIVLFTSGSTGEPKKVTCTLENIFTEVLALESVFGANMKDKPVYMTVYHQHVYGLIFTIFWPLIMGRVICFPVLEYPENIIDVALKQEAILVSTPALLKRLDFDLGQDLGQDLKDTIIFSSGGLLKKSIADLTAKIFGRYPLEVFGSTETRGVAYRQQTSEKSKNYWRCLPGVAIEKIPGTGCLSVMSPFFTEENPFIMGDQVNIFESGEFELLGRVDRIVKIEEKRVSLTEMEKRLNQHIYVDEAYALALSDHRQYIAVVIILSSLGKQKLLDLGKLGLNQALQRYLRQYFEGVLLPKRFHYVRMFPVNAQGKILLKDMQNIFNRNRQDK